jgi:hypothetical protein
VKSVTPGWPDREPTCAALAAARPCFSYGLSSAIRACKMARFVLWAVLMKSP